jgi:hypothetical protein
MKKRSYARSSDKTLSTDCEVYKKLLNIRRRRALEVALSEEELAEVQYFSEDVTCPPTIEEE